MSLGNRSASLPGLGDIYNLLHATIPAIKEGQQRMPGMGEEGE